MVDAAEFRPPRALLDIARRLDAAGHEVWAVGGAVRDVLAGRVGGDWDLATDARPDRVKQLFRRTVPIGVEHGTVGVLGTDRVLYEVTTFRRDIETDGRHATVRFADTLDEDLARRDFTINAIAWQPLRAELHDPFAGAADLRAGVLRTVGSAADRFAEDYLRVLRALRFAGRFDLRIEPETWEALRAATGRLEILSAERVREELWKVLARTTRASVTLELYRASGVLAALYPELAETVDIELGDGTAWSQAIATVDAVPVDRVLLRVAALLHTAGYPAARTRDLRGGWRHTGHERWAGLRADALMRRLKSSNADRERIVTLVAKQNLLFPPDAPDPIIRRWLVDVPPELVRDLFRLRIAMARAAEDPGTDLVERWRKAHAVLLTHPVLDVAGLAIGGNDLRALGIRPGPEYGRILEALLARVIDMPERNERETLLRIVQEDLMDGEAAF